MNMPPELLQFLGSLLAILALAGLAYILNLGGQPRLNDEEAARRAANEAVDGFLAETIAIDKRGSAALLSDSAGRILLLKPHGNKFAGRILTCGANASVWQYRLTVDTGERRYGSAVLEIDEPQAWADAINRLKTEDDA